MAFSRVSRGRKSNISYATDSPVSAGVRVPVKGKSPAVTVSFARAKAEELFGPIPSDSKVRLKLFVGAEDEAGWIRLERATGKDFDVLLRKGFDPDREMMVETTRIPMPPETTKLRRQACTFTMTHDGAIEIKLPWAKLSDAL